MNISTDSSHEVVLSAVQQYALSVEGTNDSSFLPSSPTNDNWFDAGSEVSSCKNRITIFFVLNDNWFDAGSEVSVNVQKTTEIEPNKVGQEITGWSLDKAEFWEIDDNGNTSFTTPPVSLNEYH